MAMARAILSAYRCGSKRWNWGRTI